jgi:hypothetical protein
MNKREAAPQRSAALDRFERQAIDEEGVSVAQVIASTAGYYEVQEEEFGWVYKTGYQRPRLSVKTMLNGTHQ